MKYAIVLVVLLFTISACKKKCGNCYFITTTTAVPPKIGYPAADTALFHLCGNEYETSAGTTPKSDTTVQNGYTFTTTKGYSCFRD